MRRQPQLIGMIANRDFEYGDRMYFCGDRFRVPPVDAAIIKRKQDARLMTPQDGPVEPEPEPPSKPSDDVHMHADGSLTIREMESAPAKPKRKPRKRKTNRRDIPHAPVTK